MSHAITVLGAGGFIGRHLVETFAAEGRQVIAATRSPAVFRHPAIVNVVAPFLTRGDFLPLVERSRFIIHAAASSTPGSSAAQPQLDGNLRTSLALIEALQDDQAPELIYLSSGGTLYGDMKVPAREADPLQPRSYHAAGKIAAEFFFAAWARQYDGTLTILRPSNVYGPGQLRKPGFGIIPAIMDSMLGGPELQVLGDGGARRDYLYISDLVDLVRCLLDDHHRNGVQTFNVASGNVLSLNELLDLVAKVAGRTVPRRSVPARRVDIRSIELETTAVRQALDWVPQVGMEDGLGRVWRWRLACR